MKKNLFLACVAIVLAIALISCDQGTPQITGIHNVTKGIEYLSIQEAIDGAKDGETIYVGPGSHTEAVTLSKPITLKGFGNPIIGAVTIASSNITLEGFTIKTDGTGITISHTAVPFKDIVIQHNTIDSKEHGLVRYNDGNKDSGKNVLTNLSILDNTFIGGNPDDDNQGILLFTDLAGITHIEGNTFKDKLAGLNAGENRDEMDPETSFYAKEIVYVQNNTILDDPVDDTPQFAMWVSSEAKIHDEGNKILNESIDVLWGFIPEE